MSGEGRDRPGLLPLCLPSRASGHDAAQGVCCWHTLRLDSAPGARRRSCRIQLGQRCAGSGAPAAHPVRPRWGARHGPGTGTVGAGPVQGAAGGAGPGRQRTDGRRRGGAGRGLGLSHAAPASLEFGGQCSGGQRPGSAAASAAAAGSAVPGAVRRGRRPGSTPGESPRPRRSV